MIRYRDDEEIEELATRVRQRLGVEHLLAPDAINLLERFGQIVRNFKWTTLPDDQLPSDEAFANYAERTITLRQSVYEAAARGEPQARMTVAHEIAHIVLGHANFRFRSLGKDKRSAQLPQVKAEESEAKRLGGALLAPVELLSKYTSVQEISDVFQITETAAAVRKDIAHRIARRRAGIQRELPSVVLDFLRESKKRGYTVKSIPSEPRNTLEETIDVRRTEALWQGYQSDSCSECKKSTLKRDGAGFVCDSCGSTSGCNCGYRCNRE